MLIRKCRNAIVLLRRGTMERQNRSSNPLGGRYERISYKQEICAVGVTALFLFLFIALISYSPHDNSLFHYGGGRHLTENWAGLVGAHIASVLFLVFGLTVYGILALLLLPAYRLFFAPIPQQYQGKWQRRLQAVALCGTVIVSAMIFDLSGLLFHGVSAGGLFGAWGARWLEVWFGAQGALVCTISFAWICLCYGFKISFSHLFLMFWDVLVKVARFCAQTIRGVIWRLSVKRGASGPSAGQEQTITPVAAPEDDFWAAVMSNEAHGAANDMSEQALQVVTLNEQIKTAEDRFAAKKIATESRYTRFLSKPYVYAPNSVLKSNLFVGKDGQPSIYAIIMTMKRETSSIKKSAHFFMLPEVTPGGEQGSVVCQQVVDDATQRSALLESKLLHFGVNGKVTAVKPGPVITLFEYKPDIDSKISKITALEDDLAMALTANSIRIIAPIPGKDAVGFEIANNVRTDVLMERVLQSKEWATTKARLPIMFGVDVVGNPVIQDLSSMPHLLIGGSTGSGKSVGLNVMLMSLLYKLSPEVLKLILIDPKRLEFTPYAGIPHLLFPIVTQPTQAISVLKWVVHEMESRYECMAKAGVRNMSEYQAWYKQACKTKDKDMTAFRPLPFLVVIIDELADLMMVGGKDVETHIVRIVQMARAAGIHMIIATQRPSVDVVTGLIKINFPSRIAFRVSSKVDSRTILDGQGAEKLLGRGDMLFMHSASPELKRVHGAYVTDQQIEAIAQFWRDQAEPEYIDINEVVALDQQKNGQDYQDELYGQVLDFIKHNDEISISMVQRQYRIGFNRSARLIEKLEGEGLVAPAQGSKPRKVLR